jgi:hypothetical protein
MWLSVHRDEVGALGQENEKAFYHHPWEIALKDGNEAAS